LPGEGQKRTISSASQIQNSCRREPASFAEPEVHNVGLDARQGHEGSPVQRVTVFGIGLEKEVEDFPFS
jgi:hypothetical protein